MDATILLIHGSRQDLTVSQAAALRDRLLAQPALAGQCLELAYLHFARPSLETVAADLYGRGCRKIRLLPLFTFPGNHTLADIPRICAELAQRHPDLEIAIGPPLASQPGFIEFLIQLLA